MAIDDGMITDMAVDDKRKSDVVVDVTSAVGEEAILPSMPSGRSHSTSPTHPPPIVYHQIPTLHFTLLLQAFGNH